MPTRRVLHGTLLLLFTMTAAGCLGFRPPAEPGPAVPPPWFVEGGIGAFYSDIGEDTQPAFTGAVGRRLEGTPWFAEFRTSHPRMEYVAEENGIRTDCEGWLLVHTLGIGGEFYPFDTPDLRIRGRLGGGYFHTDGLPEDDEGFATTVALAAQRRISANLWLALGLSHYGLFTDLDGDDREFRHNGMADISLVLDF